MISTGLRRIALAQGLLDTALGRVCAGCGRDAEHACLCREAQTVGKPAPVEQPRLN